MKQFHCNNHAYCKLLHIALNWQRNQQEAARQQEGIVMRRHQPLFPGRRFSFLRLGIAIVAATLIITGVARLHENRFTTTSRTMVRRLCRCDCRPQLHV